MTTARLTVRDLSKVFDQPRRGGGVGAGTFHAAMLEALARQVLRWETVTRRPFPALREMNFEVAPGEVMGIVGRNGAGKSTLLRVLARVIEPSRGTIELRGRAATLLELGTGFSGDLTVAENVRMHLALAGQAGNRALEDRIIELAGLADSRDVELDECRGGAVYALSFATLVSIHSDIVIADELLSVGNAAFKQMCLDRLVAIRAGGGSVILVSHDLDAVRAICDRVMWVEGGRVRTIGPAAVVVDAYVQSLRPAARRALPPPDPDQIAILDLALAGAREPERTTARAGGPLSFVATVRNRGAPAAMVFRLEVHHGATLVLAEEKASGPGGLAQGTHRVSVVVPGDLLREGAYEARLVARWRLPSGEAAIDRSLPFQLLAAGPMDATATAPLLDYGARAIDLMRASRGRAGNPRRSSRIVRPLPWRTRFTPDAGLRRSPTPSHRDDGDDRAG